VSNNWRAIPLSEIADINPRLGKTALEDDALYTFVPMASVGAADGSIDVTANRSYTEVKKGFTPFQSGDVLFAKITPCMENGKMAVVPKLENNYGFGSTEFHVIRPKNNIDPKYIYYFISRSDFRKEAAHNMTGAVGQKRVPTDFLKLSAIPLPPTFEDQQRIVAEIEKQFSRLDEAVASLKRIKANLKRYKAAVLKAAIVGVEEKWWQPIQVAIDSIGQGWSPKCNREPSQDFETWGVIKTTAVQAGSFLEGENKKLPEQLQPRPALEIQQNDILITRAGPKGRVGVACLVRSSRPRLMVCDKVYRLRCREKVVRPEYMELVLNAPVIVGALDELKTGISDSGVNLTQVRFNKLSIPLPPLEIQKAIIEEVERQLSVTEELEATIKTNLKRAERLRQRILSSSFRGY
jgi:type I restriction enzyme, S subunit